MRIRGTVARLVHDKGFGFLVREDGFTYFFHQSALVGAVFQELHIGQVVEFEVAADSPRGPRAGCVFVNV